MSHHISRVSATLALLLLGTTALLAADKPTKVEIGKKGKAATAFVDVPGRGSGTAFCVHPSGLFVTNEHVVRGAEKAEIILVLNPSLPGERVLKAKVVRIDKDLDLALLRVENVQDLPSLPLGSVEGVAELSDVVAVGFPLGRFLSPDRKEYPAVSVNAGSVTALRLKGRELEHIQIDISLTFGNSGGPVLDENGKVIGVVVSGIALGARASTRPFRSRGWRASSTPRISRSPRPPSLRRRSQKLSSSKPEPWPWCRGPPSLR